jgi:flagellar biosynthesis/type III secretory pathway protein FliH
MIRRIPAARARGHTEPFSTAAPGDSVRGEADPASLAQATARVDQAGAAAAAAGQRAAVARALTLLLSEELRLAPEHIERVLERELGRLRRAREIVVHVHPDDLALLRAPHHFAHSLELEGTLKLVPEPALSRGGCTLGSNLGEIDARLETRLGLVLTLLERGALV